MKQEISDKLYKNALMKAEQEKSYNEWDEIEVVMVPYVVCRKDGRVGKVVLCNTNDIK